LGELSDDDEDDDEEEECMRNSMKRCLWLACM